MNTTLEPSKSKREQSTIKELTKITLCSVVTSIVAINFNSLTARVADGLGQKLNSNVKLPDRDDIQNGAILRDSGGFAMTTSNLAMTFLSFMGVVTAEGLVGLHSLYLLMECRYLEASIYPAAKITTNGLAYLAEKYYFSKQFD